MKRYFLLTIFIITAISLCHAEGLRIIFPQGSSTVIGTAHKSLDPNEMSITAREQAAIFATKIDYSLCIFRMAYLDTDFGSERQDDSATFIVNVVADLSMLYDYLYYLKEVRQREFYGYLLNFYNLSDEPELSIVMDYKNDIELARPSLITNGNTVTGVGVAKSADLYHALNEAFKFALSEISKYQDVNIKTMQRGITEYTEQALLVDSENLVTDVCFSEIYLQQKIVDNLNSFTVKVMLSRVY